MLLAVCQPGLRPSVPSAFRNWFNSRCRCDTVKPYRSNYGYSTLQFPSAWFRVTYEPTRAYILRTCSRVWLCVHVFWVSPVACNNSEKRKIGLVFSEFRTERVCEATETIQTPRGKCDKRRSFCMPPLASEIRCTHTTNCLVFTGVNTWIIRFVSLVVSCFAKRSPALYS